MSNQLMVQMAGRFNVPESQMLQTLKATAFKGNVSDAQMTALLIVANQYGLNPWTKEIYAFPDKGGIVPVVGVDGWSRIINENPQFDGMDFEQDEQSCTCRIYRKDRSHPVAVTEYMSECNRSTQPWKSHPKRMLRHKALIQCARLAFGYTGIFDEDEAERIVTKDMGEAMEDCSAALAAINAAKSMDELQAAFTAAWKAHHTAKAREELTEAKDAKKTDLSKPVDEVVDADFVSEMEAE